VPKWADPGAGSQASSVNDASHTQWRRPGDGATRSLTMGLRALLIQYSENSAPELPRPERLLAGEELQAAGLHLQRPTARDFVARQVHRERAAEVGGRGVDDGEVPRRPARP
jgi:hypothetical protein